MKRDNLDTILRTYTLYVDTCSLMQGNVDFFKVTLHNILKETNRKLRVFDSVIGELKKKQFSEAERYALRGLDIIAHYQKHDLMEKVPSGTHTHADRNFLDAVYSERNQNNNVCLITEDKKLAKDIIINLKNLDSVNFNHKIDAVKLQYGPQLWNIDLLKQKLQLNDKEDYDLIEKQENNHRLLISLIIDNGSSIGSIRLNQFKDSLRDFERAIIEEGLTSNVDLNIIGFGGFEPKIIKNFDDPRIKFDSIDSGGIQVLGKSMELAMKQLHTRQGHYDNIGTMVYKPWLIVLSDGDAYGDLSSAIDSLKTSIKAGELIYFPFALNDEELEGTMDGLVKVKPFLQLKNNDFSGLFKWMKNTVIERLNTDITQKMTLSKEKFLGWTTL